MSNSKNLKPKKKYSSYCNICGGCGFIGCDGIQNFLEKHVKGKTNCNQEALFIEEIKGYIETYGD